jgi:hypothetical protein
MLIQDYDEFNIYTTIEDIENYVNALISEGYEIKEEIHNMCVTHFGSNYHSTIDKLFNDED